MKLNRTGSNWNELERNKINENWDIIEGGYNDVVGQITDEVVGHLIDSAKLNWKEPVETETDLPKDAEVGETRMVRESVDGVSHVYRYNGTEWELIQEIDVSLVNEVDRRLSAQLADIAVDVKSLGAVGDGVSHPLSERFQHLSHAKDVYPSAESLSDEIDQVAIQKALDLVAENGGGSVYMPAGKYVIRRKLIVDSNTVLYGAGQYNTTLLPVYTGFNKFPNLIDTTGTSSKRCKNIVLRDFGVDGSDMEFFDDIESGHWARLRLSYVDFASVYNIFYYHGSHVIDVYSCHDYFIENIIADYVFNVIHLTNPSGENCKRGVIRNLKATRCATVIDWGAGGIDTAVSGIHADARGYIRNDQEVFDIGGARNVQICDVYAYGFNDCINLKGEGGVDWDNVRVSDAHFVDFLGRGVSGSKGGNSDGKSGKLHLNNCTFVSEIETDKQTIYLTDFVDVTMNNVKVHTNSFGGGVKIEVFKRAAIDGLDIITPGNGLEIKGLQKDGFFGGDYFARNIVIDVESEGFLSSSCDGKSILENFSIKSKGLGWRISGVKYFTANNGNITDVDNHGAYIIFKDFSKIAKAGEDNYFHLDISNVAFVNWGLGSKFYQNAILFSVDNEVDGTINGLRLQNISLIIEDGKQTNQIGLDWSPFDNNKLGNSWLDGISFVNVPIPINEVSGKGEGLVERYIGVQ